MKKLALFGFLLTALAHAQVSYETLKTDIHAGVDPETIKQAIAEQGLGFEVNIELLRTMKTDRMPDWLIDFVIDYDPNTWVSSRTAPKRYSGEELEDTSFYRWNRTAYWGFSPWNCVDWYYWCGPWSPYRSLAYYGYAGLGLWWPYYHSTHYIYNTRYAYSHSRGVVTPRGYRVRDRRVVGRAVPRGTSTVARSSAVPTRTRSTATRSTSPSSSRASRSSYGTRSRSSATRSSNSRSGSSATRSTSSRTRSSASRASSSRSRSSATRSSSSRSRSSATRSSSSRSRSSATRSSSSRSRSSATRSSSSSRTRSTAKRPSSSRTKKR